MIIHPFSNVPYIEAVTLPAIDGDMIIFAAAETCSPSLKLVFAEVEQNDRRIKMIDWVDVMIANFRDFPHKLAKSK